MEEKRIVFVQVKSYDSFLGGDGLYLHGIKAYLKKLGYEITTLTSNPTKDRPRFLIRLKYGEGSGYHALMRGGVPIGGAYLILNFSLLAHLWAFLWKRLTQAKRNKPTALATDIGKGELKWINDQLARLRPVAVILCFEAAGITELPSTSSKLLRLCGFLDASTYRLMNGRVQADDRSSAHVGAQILDSGLPVGFSSRDEKEYFSKTARGSPAIYVGMGLPNRKASRTSAGKVALFIGNKTTPNQEAVEYLLTEIWPKIHSEIPGAQLRIVGNIGLLFCSDPSMGVEVAGRVDDLEAEYAAARVVVAPFASGSAGVKTKIAEAISFGKVVVTTSLGVDRSDPGQLSDAGFVEDTAVGFANRVVALLKDDALLNAKERGTRSVFHALYSDDAAYAELVDWLSR